jgi:hypothetical protein
MRRLTPERQAELVALLRQGEHLSTAAAFVGVAAKTIYVALAEGARMEEAGQKGWRVNFLHAVNGTRAEAELRSGEHVRSAAARGDWRAAAWRLQRGPAWERWCDRSKVKVELTPQQVDDTLASMIGGLETVLAAELGQERGAEVLARVVDEWERIRRSLGTE